MFRLGRKVLEPCRERLLRRRRYVYASLQTIVAVPSSFGV